MFNFSRSSPRSPPTSPIPSSCPPCSNVEHEKFDPSDTNLDRLLEKNHTWAKNITDQDPDFFKDMAKGQTPKILWIGCADSRVPSNQVLQLGPGEVFVHRNIANVVSHTDMSCLAVLQYAIEVLKVEHVIVCGKSSFFFFFLVAVVDHVENQCMCLMVWSHFIIIIVF
jgi:carbonic anhydrase